MIIRNKKQDRIDAILLKIKILQDQESFRLETCQVGQNTEFSSRFSLNQGIKMCVSREFLIRQHCSNQNLFTTCLEQSANEFHATN